MNDLKELSKENTIENFCGAAFITFNTIRDQEDFLYKNNQSCCSRLIDASYKFIYDIFLLFMSLLLLLLLLFLLLPLFMLL